jgi:hypothetical protein
MHQVHAGMEGSVHVRLERLVEDRPAGSIDRRNFSQQKVRTLVTTLPHAGSAILVALLEAVGVQASAMYFLGLVNGNVLARHMGVIDQERGRCEAGDAAPDDMRFLALDALWGRCVDAVIVLHRSLLFAWRAHCVDLLIEVIRHLSGAFVALSVTERVRIVPTTKRRELERAVYCARERAGFAFG